jgi:hypothetical protein
MSWMIGARLLFVVVVVDVVDDDDDDDDVCRWICEQHKKYAQVS